jgi:hypothetical protein
MVVSSRPSHSSRIDVVGYDIAIVGEGHLANSTLSVLLNDFSIEQLPHFRSGAEFAVSSRMVRVFDTLHSELSDSSSSLNRFAATARERSMNGTILIATEFHEFPSSVFFMEKERFSISYVPASRSQFSSIPCTIQLCPSQLADVRGVWNVSR